MAALKQLQGGCVATGGAQGCLTPQIFSMSAYLTNINSTCQCCKLKESPNVLFVGNWAPTSLFVGKVGLCMPPKIFLASPLNCKENAEIAINRTDFGIFINDKEMCWCEIYDTFFYKLPSNIGH